MSIDWKAQLGFDPETESGWILPENRPPEAAAELAAVPDFLSVNGYGTVYGDLPNEALAPVAEIKALGKLLAFIWQLTGSCVGAGSGMAQKNAAVGDVIARGDNETIKHTFWLATYGVGRELAGMRGTGSGSYGTAQAKACNEFGLLPGDDPRFPQPTITADNWMKFSSSTELKWSHPRAWPISKAELAPEASKYSIQSIARIRGTDELAKAAAQLYGITLASNFGTRNERVNEGYLIAGWTGSWAHQMSCSGYTKHPSLGRIWWIQNQWGPNAHPACPYMSKLGVRGGFWITDSTMQSIISRGEVFVHSNTKGFPARKIDWGTMGIV